MKDGRLPLLILTGPTASGKTTVGIGIARELQVDIINADSRQMYRGMTIGTAKPTPEEQALVRHHCVDILEPGESYSAGRFQHDALGLIEDATATGRLPVVVGGAGLYIRALTQGLSELPQADPVIRANLDRILQEEGLEALLEELRVRDPAHAAVVDTSNPVRIIRALEVCRITGNPYSALREAHRPVLPHRPVLFALRWERTVLYERIEARVDAMLAAGLVDEVRGLLEAGADPRWQAMRSVGYSEAVAHLRDEITHERMVELIRQHTRNLAKRQMTWFSHEPGVEWVDVAGEGDLPFVVGDIVRRFRMSAGEGRTA